MKFEHLLTADAFAVLAIIISSILAFFTYRGGDRPNLKKFSLGLFATLFLVAVAIAGVDLKVYSVSVFIVFCVLTAVFIWWSSTTGDVSMANQRPIPVTRWWGPAVFVSTFLFSVSFPDVAVLPDLLHHYDVFLFQYRSIHAGNVPFYDFPVQYGVGPLLLASFAAKTPLMLYFVTAGLNSTLAWVLIYVATDGYKRSHIETALVAIAIALASTLLAAYPAFGVRTLFYPSTGGLRYLPIAIAAYLAVRNPEMSFRQTAVVVFAAAFWSFEAGLITMIGLGLRYYTCGNLVRSLALCGLFVAGFLSGPIISLVIYGKIDWQSVVEFIGNGTPHSLTNRYLTVTISLFALLLVPLFASGPTRKVAFLPGFLLALYIYPAMRGHPTTALNVAPFVLAIILYYAPLNGPRFANSLACLVIFIVIGPYIISPASTLAPHLHIKNLIKATSENFAQYDEKGRDQTAGIMGCRGLWISPIGIPPSELEPDLNTRTSVWFLISNDRVELYQQRQAFANGLVADTDYCWIEFSPGSTPEKFRNLAEEKGLTEQRQLKDGRVIIYSPRLRERAQRL